MQRKKLFIAIVILLVLGLGLLMEYQRQTRDIGFEIPGWASVFTMSEPCWDISNKLVVYKYYDFEEGDVLAVYDLLTKTQKIIRSDFPEEVVSICEPWIVWEEITSDDIYLIGYNLHQGQGYPIQGNNFIFDQPKLDGNIVVWIEGSDIFGYDLEAKKGFSVGKEPYQPCDLAIGGDIVVWMRGDYPNTMILGYNLQSQEHFEIPLSPSPRSSLQVSGQYVIWVEEQIDNAQTMDSIKAYHLGSKELITVCTGVDCFNNTDISEEIVVWDHYRDDYGSDILGFNLKERRQFPICTAKGNQYAPKISGNTVIWYEDDPQVGWLSGLLKKEYSNIRGKIFRHWPGEE